MTDTDVVGSLDCLSAADVRERLLSALVASVFLLFFQTYMVAPLIPMLADSFSVSRQIAGLLIPAYTIPYALGALVGGVLADRFGRRNILFYSMGAFAVMGVLMAAAPTMQWLIVLRMISGSLNVGIAVMGLSLVGDLFPLVERGRALGRFFGAIAGGGALGSTVGGLLAPIIGWRGLFLLTGAFGVALLVRVLPLRRVLGEHPHPPLAMRAAGAGYLALIGNIRGARTFSYIFLNAAFHSGVFTWLGVFLHDRYGLGEAGIGLALIGYGVPGFLLGPVIGSVVDRHGRRWLIPCGFLVAASAAMLFASNLPLALAVLASPILSLGFDMTHPLLAGIATTLDERRRGLAMGLNAFAIFFGFGVGSILFGWLARSNMSHAFVVFAVVQASLGLLAIPVFRRE